MSDEYGPFAAIIAIAAALVAVFGLLGFKAIGPMSRWSWLAGNPQTFIMTAAARAVAIGIIGICYITLNKTNYLNFAIAAIPFGIAAFAFIMWFERLRQLYTCRVPELTPDGSQAVDRNGKPKEFVVIIGSEATMNPNAAKQYKRHKRPGLCKFMSGYGVNEVNNPEAIWSKAELAGIASKMTLVHPSESCDPRYAARGLP